MSNKLNFIDEYKSNYYQNLKNFNQIHNNNINVILLYHGVSKHLSNGIENHSFKHINYREFEKHMRYLKKNCSVLSMNDLIEFKKNNIKCPKNSVIISFDDGFENNYSVAAPILDQLNLPATFYITSGLIETDILFWVDIIEDCINRTKQKYINIKLNKKNITLSLINDIDKIYAINKIKNYCKRVNYKIKDKIINNLINETKIKPSEKNCHNYKKMNWQQLKQLHDNKLFLIGGHSSTHNILSLQSSKEMKDDILSSIKYLEDNLNSKIIHYSYPEGQQIHYNEEVKDFLKLQGIKCSPSAIPGLNNSASDLFELRRIMIGFWGLPLPFLDTNFR